MIHAVVGPRVRVDTLIAGVLWARPGLRLVRRVITRPEAADGEPFEGVTEAEFSARKARGAFALDWQAHGLCYGISWDQVTGPGDVVFNGSRAALPLAVQVFPGLRVILVTAPDAVLAKRLAARGREDGADIRARLARAAFTLPEGISTTVVMNDGTVEEGIARLLAALQPVSA